MLYDFLVMFVKICFTMLKQLFVQINNGKFIEKQFRSVSKINILDKAHIGPH
jgi:hypothetical protein